MSKVNTNPLKGKSMAERRAWRRQKFIEAALKEYGKNGFDRTTIKEVCLRANLTERYFYEAFLNADQLKEIVFEQVCSGIYEKVIVGIDSTARGSEIIRTMIAGFCNFFLEDYTVSRLFAVEIYSSRNNEGIRKILNEFLIKYSDTVANYLQLQSRNRLLEMGVLGGILEIIRQWVDSGCKEPVEEVTETSYRLAKVLLDD